MELGEELERLKSPYYLELRLSMPSGACWRLYDAVVRGRRSHPVFLRMTGDGSIKQHDNTAWIESWRLP